MNKRVFKNVLTFMLTFAMLFTNILGIDLVRAASESDVITYIVENADNIRAGGKVVINFNIDAPVKTESGKYNVMRQQINYDSDIPEVDGVSSASIKLDKVEFDLPEDLEPGEYKLTNGYVNMGYYTAYDAKIKKCPFVNKDYFKGEMPDITINVKEKAEGGSETPEKPDEDENNTGEKNDDKVDDKNGVSYEILNDKIEPGDELQVKLSNLNLENVTSIKYTALDKNQISSVKADIDKENKSASLKFNLPENIEEGEHKLAFGYTYNMINMPPPFPSEEKKKDRLPDIIFNVAYSTKDTKAPSITLKGKEKVVIIAGETYKDAGANAKDDRDKNVDVKVTYSKDGQPVEKIDTNIKGTYLVYYNAKDSAENKAKEVIRKVVVSDVNKIDFTSDVQSGAAPLSVTFNAIGDNEISTYAWDFNNDGVVDSTDAKPKYGFPKAGTYSVKLTVNGKISETKTDYITVDENKTSKTEEGWLQYQNNNLNIYNRGITNEKTPISNNLKEIWHTQASSGMLAGVDTAPLVVGDSVYVISSGANIYKLNKETGKIIWGPKVGEGGFGLGSIAYGDGKIFVPKDGASIVAINADNGETLWEAKVLKGQMNTPISFKDGLVYTGSWDKNNGGQYVCVTKNGELVWKYEGEGFYWAGAAIIGDSIVFGDEGGNLISLDRFTGKKIQKTNVTGGAIRSSINYNKESGKIYFTSKDGNIISIKMNEDGTFDDKNKIVKALGAQSTSTPVVYNGRIYLGVGGMSGGSGLKVLNAKTLEEIYTAKVGAIQSSPVLSTAYATEENKHTVYIYFTQNSSEGPVYCIKDFEGNTKESQVFKYIPSIKQYCLSGVSVYDGVMYFGNDSGNVFAVKSEEIEKKKDFTITRVGEGNLHLGQDAKVEINAKNTSDVEKPCMLIVALYDKDTGKMVNYSYVKKTVKSGETENMTSGFTMPEKGNYEVKAMVWDKLDTMKPLSDCIKLDVVE